MSNGQAGFGNKAAIANQPPSCQTAIKKRLPSAVLPDQARAL
jgi:hypothetical protein